MKASSPLLDLSADGLDTVLVHPAQKVAFRQLVELIGWLRECREPADYSAFQRQLFSCLHQVEQRRSECARSAKRLRSGKAPLPGIDPLPSDRDSSSLEQWLLEEYIFARLARQFRTVGDGLAWRSFGFDRRLILALSRNAAAGPMFGKSGLPHELGRVEDLWREKGHFGLLHDLTNCLRIADISEFTSDSGVLFHEVKATPHTDKKQLARLQAVVDAVMHGSPLPGENAEARLVEIDAPYRTNLAQLNELLQLAKRDGCRGMKLGQGRAVVATSLVHAKAEWPDDPESAAQRVAAERAGAIKRAGIASAMHHLTARSADTAARSPIMAPFSIYPFSPEDCAALICDLLIFETILSDSALVGAATDLGLTARIVLPPRSSHLAIDQDVIQVGWKDRRLTLHNQGLNTLLYELLEPTSWARGVQSLLMASAPIGEPVVVFKDEAQTWAGVY